METGDDITESSPPVVEEKIFVAVGNVLAENTPILLSALKNFRRNKNICILHVHQPAQEIRVLGGKFRVEELDVQQVRAHREMEKQRTHNILNDYLYICRHAGVSAEAIHIEMDNIERGIVELIIQHGITKLFMGAAADIARNTVIKLKSKSKAKFVFEKAPISCHIWFVCNRNINLTVTRQELIEMAATTSSTTPVSSPSHRDSPISTNGQPELTKSGSHGGSPFQKFIRILSGQKDPQTTRRRSKSSDRSSSGHSISGSTSNSGNDRSDDETRVPPICESTENPNDSSTANEFPLAKESESLEEKSKDGRKEQLDREMQELENLKSQLYQVKEELQFAVDQKVKLDRQIADSDQMVADLVQQKVLSAAQELVAIQRELEKLKIVKEEEFRPQFFSVFSALDIESATWSFDPSMKIGEGGFGTVYKGIHLQTPVAIKRSNSQNLEGQSSSDFQREVDVLSKVRHPNIVTLIGVCPEASSLVLEYLPNGNLEDRLSCKVQDGTPPLSWKTRMRIAKEICSALIFLHSHKPESVVHGDLKPSNIFLDVNFVSKLGDFGIATFIPRDESSTQTDTLSCLADPKGTIAYVDPELLVSGRLTTKADVYSFGVILLRLLTGEPAMGLARKVQSALDQGNLNAMLDASAGDWPLVQAEQLTQMALRCCEMKGKDRPNLALDVSRLLLSLDIET